MPVAWSMAGAAFSYVAITGQWSLRITIRSDAFDETTVTIPAAVR